jgi:hypothetical protein
VARAAQIANVPRTAVLRAILPALAIATVAAVIVHEVDDRILDAGNRHVIVGLATLTLEMIMFVLIYLAAMRVAAPATTRESISSLRYLRPSRSRRPPTGAERTTSGDAAARPLPDDGSNT